MDLAVVWAVRHRRAGRRPAEEEPGSVPTWVRTRSRSVSTSRRPGPQKILKPCAVSGGWWGADGLDGDVQRGFRGEVRGADAVEAQPADRPPVRLRLRCPTSRPAAGRCPDRQDTCDHHTRVAAARHDHGALFATATEVVGSSPTPRPCSSSPEPHSSRPTTNGRLPPNAATSPIHGSAHEEDNRGGGQARTRDGMIGTTGPHGVETSTDQLTIRPRGSGHTAPIRLGPR
jgi:hypothetical protein